MSVRRTAPPGPVLLWGAAAGALAAAVVLAVLALSPVASNASAAPTAGPADSGLGIADTALLAAEPMAPTPAPGFTLTDQHGHRSSLSDFRGRAVVLSFNDDRCTDICTLLAQDVVAADRDLGANRSEVAFVSVNANPYYPSSADVRKWTDAHGLGSVANWSYDTGSPARLAEVAKAFGETVKLDPKARSIEHGTRILFLDPEGRERLIGMYGTETADTAAFGHALADAAVSVLPADRRHPVRGTAAGASAGRGASAPGGPIRLPQLGGGKPVTLGGGSRYTVLTFFSSTCTVCSTELPGIEREYRATGSKVVYLGIDVADQDAAALRLVRRSGVRYPVGVDRNGAAAARFGATGLPYTVILDPSGRVVTSHPGLLTADQLDYLLKVLPDS